MTEWEYLTVPEFAEILQLNKQTVRNWITAGELESVKVGRAVRIPRRAAIALTGGRGYDIPELMTIAQVAERLRLNEQTVRNWIDAGDLPAVRVGDRRVRIKRSVVDEIGNTGLRVRPRR